MGGLNLQIAAESDMSYMFMTLMAEAEGLQHNREKNKQVSKVIERFLRLKPMCLL